MSVEEMCYELQGIVAGLGERIKHLEAEEKRMWKSSVVGSSILKIYDFRVERMSRCMDKA